MVNIPKDKRQYRDSQIILFHNLGYSQLAIVDASSGTDWSCSPNTVNKVIKEYDSSKVIEKIKNLRSSDSESIPSNKENILKTNLDCLRTAVYLLTGKTCRRGKLDCIRIINSFTNQFL